MSFLLVLLCSYSSSSLKVFVLSIPSDHKNLAEVQWPRWSGRSHMDPHGVSRDHLKSLGMHRGSAYRPRGSTQEWLTTRNSHPASVLTSSFTKTSHGLRVCLRSLGGTVVSGASEVCWTYVIHNDSHICS